MRILAVEENPEALRLLSSMIGDLKPEAELLCYTGSLEALAKAREEEISLAFLSVEMPELNGIDLGQYLEELYPQVNLIFLSDGQEAAYRALSMHASGYLLKPPSLSAMRREVEDLRHPDIEKSGKRVFAQTFGNFEFFVDGQPVNFKYSRTKEILALLINRRGAQTTNGELIASMWEDDGDPEKKASYLSNLRQDLQNTLSKLKLNGIIIKQRGSMAIATDKIDCDLYEWLDRKKDSRYHYMGEYMNQYSWSEDICAELDELSYTIDP